MWEGHGGGGARRADGKLAGRKLSTTYTRPAEARDRSAAALGDLVTAADGQKVEMVGSERKLMHGANGHAALAECKQVGDVGTHTTHHPL